MNNSTEKEKTASLILTLKGPAAELGLLRGELNKQVTRILEVQESVTLKIAEVEKSVLYKKKD